MTQMDEIVRAIAKDGEIRAFGAVTTEVVETARRLHNTSPVITAGLGRLLTGSLMMGVMMKGEKDKLTVRINGDGPVMGMTAVADAKGHVKGLANVPAVIIPARESDHKLDVGAAVGKGTLTVIKDLGLKEPYVSQTELVSGEIGDDLTYYFASSEQVPSAVGLGVLMNKDNTVRCAGGFVVQLMPFAKDETIEAVENAVSNLKSVTDIIDGGADAEGLLRELLGDMGLEITDHIPAEYYCGCSKERFAEGIAAIGAKDLMEMIEDDKPVEAQCHFCNRKYVFEVSELRQMLKDNKTVNIVDFIGD